MGSVKVHLMGTTLALIAGSCKRGSARAWRRRHLAEHSIRIANANGLSCISSRVHGKCAASSRIDNIYIRIAKRWKEPKFPTLDCSKCSSGILSQT